MPVIHLPDGRVIYQIEETIRIQGLRQSINRLLQDDNLEEIVYNGPQQPLNVYHKTNGFIPTNIQTTEQEARQWILNTAAAMRANITEQNPLLDGTLPDGSRINITIPPATPSHSTFTIRKFKKIQVTITDLIRSQTFDANTAAFLWTAVEGLSYRPANILVVGGTGTGKTTLLNALTHFIPANQRVLTIEDTAELQLLHTNKAALLARKETNLTMDSLLKNALRMRPDRIIVGEVRGAEANTLFEAMTTGHQGTLGTLHAENAREAITRITTPPMNVPPTLLAPLDLIIVLKRIATTSGTIRVITEITETNVVSGGEVRYNILYQYDPKSQTLKSTNIPSRLRAQISSAAGITPKKYDEIIQDRAQTLTELSRQQNITPWYAFHAYTQLKDHWRLESKQQKHESIIKKVFAKIFRQ